MAKLKIQIPFTSRYKSTPIYSKKGRVFFGIWNAPEIPLDGDEKILTIEPEHKGQLDLLALQEYGDRALWWVIAKANNIRSVTDEVVAGRVVIIPKVSNVNAALLESKDATGF